MRIASLLLILASTAFFGCSRDPYDGYIGYWERKDAKRHEVLQISKDGDSLLMNDNILNETDAFGRPKKAMVLRKSEGQLSVENGFGAVILGLSEDGQTLRAANQEFGKVSEAHVEKLKEKIANDKAEFQKNKALCDEITKEHKDATNALNKEKLPIEELRKKRLELKDATIEKAKQVPKCQPGFFW